MSRTFVAVIALAAFGASPPRIVSHTAPRLAVDATLFASSRIKGKLRQLGCDRIFVSDALGGLRPPIAYCFKERSPLAKGESIRGPKGMLQIYERFVVLDQGAYRLIRNADELKKRLAPIESAEEAFSYAIAATGFGASYGFKPQPGLRYFVDLIEETFITTDTTGFTVHNLHDYEAFGCGSHPTFLVDIRVTRSGDVSETSRTRAFEETQPRCVD